MTVVRLVRMCGKQWTAVGGVRGCVSAGGLAVHSKAVQTVVGPEKRGQRNTIWLAALHDSIDNLEARLS